MSESTSNKRSPHIVIAGQFPPPVTGFAYITQKMAELIASTYTTTIIDLSAHRKRGGITYHLHRLALTLRGIGTLARQVVKQHAPVYFYIACEGNMGLIYTITLCTAARLFRTTLFIHHHSFGYIDNPSRLMSLLVAITGDKATHIFLCQKMSDLFAARYNKQIKSEILSNSAFVNASPTPPEKPRSPLVIGLLSNLNNAKGLDSFLDLLKQIAKENLAITGILAGPPDSATEQAVIDTARRELGDRLDYRGALYGEAKDAFYRSIDVFVFPTRNEAQPTVVYEAMANGVPILSYDRGCILSQVGKCGAVLSHHKDFVPFALEWLKAKLAAPEDMAQLKLDALEAFKEDCVLSRQKVATLFAHNQENP